MSSTTLAAPVEVLEACAVDAPDVRTARVEFANPTLVPAPSARERRVDKPEPLIERVKRVGRSTMVGILATIVDQTIFQAFKRIPVLHAGVTHATTLLERATFGMHSFHSDDLGKTLAVIGGTTVQFVGSRHFAFRATHGQLSRQMKRFVVAEATAFVLTILVFHVLATYLPLPSDIASLLSGSIVYFGFSYPIWKRVFAVAPGDSSGGPDASGPTGAVRLDRAA